MRRFRGRLAFVSIAFTSRIGILAGPAPEIRRRGFLSLRRRCRADRARAREQIEQAVAVAAPNHPLQRRQILVEPTQHLQHRILVVEEHVAPHRRIGSGDAREIAKAAGGKFDDLRARRLLEIGGRADDIVGDEMRNVAGDRQHQIVMRRRHHLDIRSDRLPKRPHALDGARIGALRRRRMHHRLTNNVANPASGPDCSVPATGCAGTRCASSGRWGAIAAITAPFTEPTSETIAPGLQRRPDLARDRLVRADGDAKDHEIRSRRRLGRRSREFVAEAERARARRASREQSANAIVPAAFLRRAARAIEDPISPTPTIAIRSKSGSASGGPSLSATTSVLHELRQRCDDPSLASSVPTVRRKQSGRP